MITTHSKLISIFNKNIPYLFQNFLYTQFNDTIYETNLLNFKSTQIITKSNYFLIKNDILFFCNSDIYKYDLNEKTHIKVFSGIGNIMSFNFYKDTFIIFYSNNEVYVGDVMIIKTMSNKYTVDNCWLKIYENDNVISIHMDTFEKNVCENKNLNSNKNNENLNTLSVYDKNIIIINNNFIFGDLENILEIKQENDLLFVSIENKLVYTILNNDANCLVGNFVDDHEDTILSVCLYKNKLVTTSKDGKCILYELEKNSCENNLYNENVIKETSCFNDERKESESKLTSYIEKNKKYHNTSTNENIKLTKLNEYDTGVMNSSDINEEICVMVGDDGILNLLTLETLEINLVKISEKDLNSVKIHKNLIFIGCSDKTLRILDFNLNTIHTINDHKKSVMCVSTGHKYFCTASGDKTIRVYDYNYQCVSVLSGHDSGILFCKFVSNVDYCSNSDISNHKNIINVDFNNENKNIAESIDKVDNKQENNFKGELDNKTETLNKNINKHFDDKINKNTSKTKLISSSVGGIIKIWDFKKGVCLDTLEVGNDVWSFECKNDLLIVNSEKNLVTYKYGKKENKNNIHLKNKEYEKIETDNKNLIYLILKETLYKNIFDEKNNVNIFENKFTNNCNLNINKNSTDDFSKKTNTNNLNMNNNNIDNFKNIYILNKYKNLLYETLSECGRIKDIEIINYILDWCIHNKLYDKKIIEKLSKWFNRLDEMYGDLIGMEIGINKK